MKIFFLPLWVTLFSWASLEIISAAILWKKPTYTLNWSRSEPTEILPNDLPRLEAKKNEKASVPRTQNLEEVITSNNPVREWMDYLWVPLPNEQTKQVYFSKQSGEKAFEIKVSTDSQGRRQDLTKKSGNKINLVGFGCSVTWGHGVSDDETFLAKIKETQKRFETFNLAYEGYGPNEIFLRSKDSRLYDGLKGKPGIGAYFYFDEHSLRFAHSLRVVGSWMDHGVVLREIGIDSFEAVGNVRGEFPIWTIFSRWWANDPLIKLLNLDFPLESEEHWDRLARLISATRRNYRTFTLEQNPFLLVVLPMGTHQKTTSLKRALAKKEIPVLDYSKVDPREMANGSPMIPGDGHPSAEFHKQFAGLLAEDLLSFYNAESIRLKLERTKRLE